MAHCNSDDSLSDDEVFFGKLTLKEVKKRLLYNHRQNITCGTETIQVSNAEKSINIIETNSEPDMRSLKDAIASLDDWNITSVDDSFLKIEEMVTEFCTSPNKTEKENLDNTLDVVNFILNNVSSDDTRNNKSATLMNEKGTEENDKVTDSLKICAVVSNENVLTTDTANLNSKGIDSPKSCTEESYRERSEKTDLEVRNENLESTNTTKATTKTQIKDKTSHRTPSKTPLHLKNFIQNHKIKGTSTPLAEIKQIKEVFKTPKNPILKKSQTPSTKKTPSKTNAFEHIASPVASYIKNCPQVPLLKDVHPRKPLPGSSSIPKLTKNTYVDKGKENFLLPSVAYRSAKETKMITIPDREKLPVSPWAKKIASVLPKPVVIRHVHREVNTEKNRGCNHQDDSLANLSLHQADVSLCIQKSAVSK